MPVLGTLNLLRLIICNSKVILLIHYYFYSNFVFKDYNAKLSDFQLAEISYSFADYFFHRLQKTALRKNDFTGAPSEYLSTGMLKLIFFFVCW